MGNLFTKEHFTQWHQKRRQQETQVKERKYSRLNAQFVTLLQPTELDQWSKVLSDPLLEPKKVSPIQQLLKVRVENGTIRPSINGSNHQLITHQEMPWLSPECQTLRIEVTSSLTLRNRSES